MDFLNKKCTSQIACNLRPKSSDKSSGSESTKTSDSSVESSVSSGPDTEESKGKDSFEKLPSKKVTSIDDKKKRSTKARTVKRYMVYRTINGEKKLIFFRLGDLRAEQKWDPEDPNRGVNGDPEKYYHGFDYHGAPSVHSEEELELEPFPPYVEPDLAEMELIAEDIIEVGARNEGVSSSSSDSSPVSSDANDESSGSEEVLNFQPLNKKPRFKFSPSSSLSSKLPDFLASMKAANEDLQADISAGKQDHLLEIEDTAEDEDEDEDQEGQEGQEERPYIEMDLGLGVLEETAEGSSSSDSSSDEATAASDSRTDITAGKSGTKKPVIIEEL